MRQTCAFAAVGVLTTVAVGDVDVDVDVGVDGGTNNVPHSPSYRGTKWSCSTYRPNPSALSRTPKK